MPRARLHGTTLVWTCEGSAPDLVTALGLAEGIGDEAGRGDLAILLRPTLEPLTSAPASEGHRPVFFHGVVQAYLTPDGRYVLWDRASRFDVDPQRSRIEAHIAEPRWEIVPGSAKATLEIALALVLRAHGLFHLHAGAVAHPGGAGVLLAGASGAGKTTAVIALVEAGYAFLGDDALLVTAAPSGVAICAFPRPFHVAPATLQASPRLAAMAQPSFGRGDKRDVDPRRAFPDRQRPTLGPPALVLHPRVEPASPTALAPLPPAEGLGNLIASSGGLVIEGTARRAEHVALLGRIAAKARHVELRMGQDLLRDPARLAQAVGDLLARPS
jgi:hypothetical protein